MLTAQSDVIFVFNMLFFRDGSNRPVSFDYVSYNNLSQFRSNISVFRFKTNTFYWMSISADIPSYTQVNLSMNDEFSLVKTNTLLNVQDNLCKDELFKFDKPAEYISVVSSFSTNAIYGSGFQLDTLFYPLIAFQIAFSLCLEGNNKPSTVYHNMGNAWTISKERFIAPSHGLYYFSVNIRISAGRGLDYQVKHNGNDICSLQKGMADSLISISYFDFMSKSCFIKMKVSDYIELSMPINNKCTNSSELLSLSGFNYSPKNTLKVM